MEPIIYKSGAYKSPGIYKGAGGIYNGRGIYNDGAGGGGENVIGGREYAVVDMPDGHTWLAENLDYKFNGCGIGGPLGVTTPNAWYYNNDEATYGIDNSRHCGLLYNWYALNYLNVNRETICPGWHVPSRTEWNNLINSTGGTSSIKLKSVRESWFSASWTGSDDYGFKIIPSGQCAENQFMDISLIGVIWTATQVNATYAYGVLFNTNTPIGIYDSKKIRGRAIRLVKDY